MAKELYPSSFECDCGNESDFFENTVNEMKSMSNGKKVRLSDDFNHTIVFYNGEAVEIICPKLGVCKII
jgi:hypothetical protein